MALLRRSLCSRSPLCLSSLSQFNASPKQLYVLGNPISKSKSPLIHNTGYQALNLPHEFSFIERPKLTEEIHKILHDE